MEGELCGVLNSKYEGGGSSGHTPAKVSTLRPGMSPAEAGFPWIPCIVSEKGRHCQMVVHLELMVAFLQLHRAVF